MGFPMRITVAAIIAVGLIAAPCVISTASADTMKNCAANWKAMSAADRAKTTYKEFSSTCMKGGAATATKAAAASTPAAATATKAAASSTPAAAMKTAAAAGGPAPAGATGQCKDGSYTTSKTHSGACSHHGGVTKWL